MTCVILRHVIWNGNKDLELGSTKMGFPGGAVVKDLLAKAGDDRAMDFIPRLGRSPGGGNANPLQYSCLENPWTMEHDKLQSMGSQRVGLD